jgi:hypothetical protein
MQTKLSGAQQLTYQSIFHHPMSHNVEWRSLHSMFQALGDVVDDHEGTLTVTRNGHQLVLHPATANDVAEISSLMEIRHFLRSSGSKETPPVPVGDHVLVVIDHQEARIFKCELHGTVPEKISPHDPHGFGRHLHNVHDHTKGQHHPVPESFYQTVAKSLQGASQILMFGNGSGGGSAMNQLIAYLRKSHKDLFEHVIGARVVDESHLTDDQLLAKARDFYRSSWGANN